MFTNNKKLSLKKFQDQRKEGMSIFGFSAEFDWLVINLITVILLLSVFVYSILEIKKTLSYEPEQITSLDDLVVSKKTEEKLKKIISRFEERENMLKIETIETVETVETVEDETLSL